MTINGSSRNELDTDFILARTKRLPILELVLLLKYFEKLRSVVEAGKFIPQRSECYLRRYSMKAKAILFSFFITASAFAGNLELIKSALPEGKISGANEFGGCSFSVTYDKDLLIVRATSRDENPNESFECTDASACFVFNEKSGILSSIVSGNKRNLSASTKRLAGGSARMKLSVTHHDDGYSSISVSEKNGDHVTAIDCSISKGPETLDWFRRIGL